MKLFDRDRLFGWLRSVGSVDWANQLETLTHERFTAASHGDLPRWQQAWAALPKPAKFEMHAISDAVQVIGELSETELVEVRERLMEFHPWRKGPFQILGTTIDTEWRSNLKWDRLASAFDFTGKSVLDIGCGNGYYGWRMLAAGAQWVVGCDPTWLSIMQFEVLRKYADADERHFILPLKDTDLPPNPHRFDVVCSMGVLYHRTSPIDHLQTLASALKSDGELVLETLIVDSEHATVLVPADRYAKMRNVWFLPSLSMLRIWLQRTGFEEVCVVSDALTRVSEQRGTRWMRFESLVDFLDPSDCSRTLEGYPAPRRALLTARRR
ncbi:tRNA 5-methoxyuridine(34)/uridine 5-oxyacetic acid(34) synthase CmoB [Aureliella helgolandensis]|uniref:tRNA (Mo5U34)-methyltransferase n=1 Tax=Aureliella helgolandensis TaxID=2527968 RepID=A0A518GEV0_9BACT|nr:tRNA 5-methoxyuridine(34)/uridine 5-oxyacetic acid(34) synthase CmoB [Aureliella helgolandensis]QDV27080.1 tRNA (mo5U34)-methyltransferase [Aureliella helgolandensis]